MIKSRSSDKLIQIKSASIHHGHLCELLPLNRNKCWT